jgi:hypothetical protein
LTTNVIAVPRPGCRLAQLPSTATFPSSVTPIRCALRTRRALGAVAGLEGDDDDARSTPRVPTPAARSCCDCWAVAARASGGDPASGPELGIHLCPVPRGPARAPRLGDAADPADGAAGREAQVPAAAEAAAADARDGQVRDVSVGEQPQTRCPTWSAGAPRTSGSVTSAVRHSVPLTQARSTLGGVLGLVVIARNRGSPSPPPRAGGKRGAFSNSRLIRSRKTTAFIRRR